MWPIGNFLFLCFIFAPQIRGQTSGTLNNPNEYIIKVIDALWVKIKEHGISNLPVPDTALNYNYTGFGVEFVGPVTFEDGFVQDIDSISLNTRNFQTSAPLTHAAVTGEILFENLRIFRDLRADFASGMIVGSAIITGVNFRFQFNIMKLHGNDTVTPTMTFNAWSTPLWDIFPDTVETQLMRRQMANQTLHSSVSPEWINSAAVAWIPLFTGFLTEIVQTIDFPELMF